MMDLRMVGRMGRHDRSENAAMASAPWRACRGWTGGVPGFLERQRGLAGLTGGAARLWAFCCAFKKKDLWPFAACVAVSLALALALALAPTPSLIGRREEDAAVGGAADGSCPWIASIGGNRVGGSWCEGKGGAPRRRSGLKPELGTNVSSCFFFSVPDDGQAS
jgi:hypothetical protein